MPVADADIRAIQTYLAPIIGLSAWEVKVSFGGVKRFEFGKPMLVQTKTSAFTSGTWSFWIDYTPWRIDQDHEPIAGSEDPDETIETAVKVLEI